MCDVAAPAAALLAAWLMLTCATALADGGPMLESRQLALRFDGQSGGVTAVENRLTSEVYAVRGDEFALEADGFRLGLAEAPLRSLRLQRETLRARYEGRGLAVDMTYTLRRGRAFAEKRMVVTADRGYALRRVVVSRPSFSGPGLGLVCYRYPKFGRPPGAEPIRTYFGRTARGGLFTGLALPFDGSRLDGNELVLAYAPSLKVRAGERLECEPMYLGVYQREPGEDSAWGPHPTADEVLPLRSESEAMVAMTSAVLGPPRHGLVPMACGWHSEMQQFAYTSEEDVEENCRSLDFLSACGVDWVSDSHPWGGETQKMNALVDDGKYEIGAPVRRFLEHASQVGVKVVMWPTMNNTHPWSPEGRPFRADRPEWLMVPGDRSDKPDFVRSARANCLANRPFFEWLTRLNLDGLATGYYASWAMDGSFFGDGGWYTSIVPVDCASNAHDHLPGDANYACERALNELIATVRRQYPKTFIFMCRPPMDLGVWSLCNVDACFTLLETGTGGSNLAAGDGIRQWSRVRVHRDFFPHYLDQPLLFPSRADRAAAPNWPTGHLDYILLSALSCSPNQLLYLPTKTGIPDGDKAEIRRWLEWGRRNIAYLQVRRDLPHWPGEGRVDGSAHVVGDRGLIFLFNPSQRPLKGEFALTGQSIGLQRGGRFAVTQEYPASTRTFTGLHGDSVTWDVPPESAVVLQLKPAEAR
jgi:hypothetical protein